jgi:hypothetical protein
LKKLIRTGVLAVALGLGLTGIAAPANAMTTSYYYTTACYGADLWKVKVTYHYYSIWEKSLWPYPKDYVTRQPISLQIHNYRYCAKGSFA